MSSDDVPDNDGKSDRRLRNFAKRLFREEEGENQSEDSPKASNREILGAILETGDKAKTEVVKMVGREVRSYLEALDIHNDVRQLLTNYSLEVKASIHLKPLNEEGANETEESDKKPSDD
jgi:hypothetical protein